MVYNIEIVRGRALVTNTQVMGDSIISLKNAFVLYDRLLVESFSSLIAPRNGARLCASNGLHSEVRALRAR